MRKNIAIIQARMGSTRLPNKMLLSLHGKPIIEWVVQRVLQAKELDDVIVAIPLGKQDDILAYYLNRLNVNIFRGSEENVLERFVLAGKEMQATHVIRVCADNPLVSGKEIDKLIQFYNKNRCDYAYNHIPKDNNYPDGLGAEIVSYDLLRSINKKVNIKHYQEHCMSYITDNPDKFVIRTFDAELDIGYPMVKLDVDTFEDYSKLALKSFELDSSDKDIIDIFRSDSEVS